jgi:hypothetical protein
MIDPTTGSVGLMPEGMRVIFDVTLTIGDIDKKGVHVPQMMIRNAPGDVGPFRDGFKRRVCMGSIVHYENRSLLSARSWRVLRRKILA